MIKKTVHLIYPASIFLDTNPWSIGNNVIKALKNDFCVKTYLWTSLGKISPNKGDILIGHCNSNPFTIFQRSLRNENWSKVILLQPYNEDPMQLSYLYNVIDKCDYFLAICGDYWFKRISNSKFKKWKPKMIQQNLGINQKLYPFIKKKFNKKGERKFLYIGNDYAYNNFAKNLPYLKKISESLGIKYFATAGNKKVGSIKHFGWLNFQDKKSLDILKNYDFLIQTSTNDANPSTILEAISRGLIPVATKQCGYSKENSIINIPLNNLKKTKKILNYLQHVSANSLKKIQQNNNNLLTKKYNWSNFQKTIIKTIIYKKRNLKKINYSLSEKLFFQKNKEKSRNYYMNLDMIFIILKSNISFFVKKFFFKKNLLKFK